VPEGQPDQLLWREAQAQSTELHRRGRQGFQQLELVHNEVFAQQESWWLRRTWSFPGALKELFVRQDGQSSGTRPLQFPGSFRRRSLAESSLDGEPFSIPQ